MARFSRLEVLNAIAARTAQVLAWIRGATPPDISGVTPPDVSGVRGKSVFAGVEHVGLYPFGGATGKDIADWYNQVFDFSVQEGKSSFFVQGPGPGRIEVMKESEADRCHVAIRVYDFEEAAALLKARGIELEEIKAGPDFKAAFLRQTDPAGNRVHLLWRRV